MILYGASGHAKVIIDILFSQGIVPEFIVDDNEDVSSLLGLTVRRDTGIYNQAIISIGKNEIRKIISEKIKVGEYLTAIHTSAVIANSVKIGHGSVVMQGSVIQSCAEIGKHCIVNTLSSIDHECFIGDFVHISPNSTLCGNVTIGEGTWVGAGSVITPGVKIGKWSVIGAGSVVTKDIPDNVLAVGNRCKIIKTIR